MQQHPLPWQQQSWLSISSALGRQKLAHALLLVGPSGIGKRHFASVLSQALLCQKPQENSYPCGQCHACALVNAGTHPDLHRLEKEEGSKVVKVDDVREFNRKVFLTPSSERGNVGVIDPVDGLNRSSANALLKSLEEPPRGAHILLIGERWLSLPATLRSRCLTLRLPSPRPDQVENWLTERGELAQGTSYDRLRARYRPDLARQREWADSMAGLCAGKLDPVQLAERWQKLEGDITVLLDWLHGYLADLIKLKHLTKPTGLNNPDSIDSLRSIAKRIPMDGLLDLGTRNMESKRLINTQAKPQMLLENLLASWYQGSLATATAAKNGAGTR
jgi:DNA polymerase III subunit delta'